MSGKDLVLLVTCVLNFGLSLFILFRGRRNVVGIFFGITVFWVALWSLGVFFFQWTDSLRAALYWGKIFYLSAALIASTFFYFSLIFPAPITRLSSMKMSLIFGYPFFLLWGMLLSRFLVHDVVRHPWGKEVVLGRGAYLVYSLWFLTMMGAAFVHLHQKYRLFDGLPKLQIKYVLVGTLVSTLFGAIFNLVLPLLGNYQLIWLGPPFTVIMVIMIAYAMFKHRLMNIEIVLKRTIIYTILLVVGLTFYGVLIIFSQQFFQDALGKTFSMFIGAFLMAVGFEPFRRYFQKKTETIFFKREQDPQEVLSVISELFSSIVNLSGTLASVAEVLTRFFLLDRVAILLVGEDDRSLNVEVQVGFRPPLSSFSRESPLVRYFQRDHVGKQILEFYDLKKCADEVSPSYFEMLEEMEKFGIAVVVPVTVKGRLVGMFFLGAKRSGEIFTNEDIRFLEIIAHQAGSSIENARLYQRVQNQVEQLKESQAREAFHVAKLATIGEMASSVAHELNNPLTTLLGFISLLKEQFEETDPRKRDIEVIEGEALRFRSIVRNLLDFSRKKDPKKSDSNINDLLRSSLHLVKYNAEVSNITVREEYLPDLPPALVDADQIKQVFLNVVKNALDAMPGGGTLTLRTGLIHSNGNGEMTDGLGKTSDDQIEVSVIDTGCGISPEHMKKIFDPFFTTKERAGGTGLGLAVSLAIVERHRGRIEVESEVGAGTTFRVILPVR